MRRIVSSKCNVVANFYNLFVQWLGQTVVVLWLKSVNLFICC